MILWSRFLKENGKRTWGFESLCKIYQKDRSYCERTGDPIRLASVVD